MTPQQPPLLSVSLSLGSAFRPLDLSRKASLLPSELNVVGHHPAELSSQKSPDPNRSWFDLRQALGFSFPALPSTKDFSTFIRQRFSNSWTLPKEAWEDPGEARPSSLLRQSPQRPLKRPPSPELACQGWVGLLFRGDEKKVFKEKFSLKESARSTK